MHIVLSCRYFNHPSHTHNSSSLKNSELFRKTSALSYHFRFAVLKCVLVCTYRYNYMMMMVQSSFKLYAPPPLKKPRIYIEAYMHILHIKLYLYKFIAYWLYSIAQRKVYGRYGYRRNDLLRLVRLKYKRTIWPPYSPQSKYSLYS